MGSRAQEEERRTTTLIAYRVGGPPMRLVPAPSSRGWMDATADGFANRCLPLRIANQAGWFILNDRTLRATWDGGQGKSSVRLDFLDGDTEHAAGSHFGHGILTWSIPYLFRTPSGYNLLARGPANSPKDGAYPLEGLVETDWAVSTFTMNWKLTRAGQPVIFEAGEPICMIVPQRRGELETFSAEIRDLEDDPRTAQAHHRWAESRDRFLAELEHTPPGTLEVANAWQKHYMRGTSPGDVRAHEHQTKLRLRPFKEM